MSTPIQMTRRAVWNPFTIAWPLEKCHRIRSPATGLIQCWAQVIMGVNMVLSLEQNGLDCGRCASMVPLHPRL